MNDFYIRKPGGHDSQGPFDPAKLATLAKADQITPDTLYYDEDKEAWLPIAVNQALKAQVFPEPDKLILKPQSERTEQVDDAPNGGKETRNAPESETGGRSESTRRQKSLERASSIAPGALGLMLILSGMVVLLPIVPAIEGQIESGTWGQALNFPGVWIGAFDLILGVLLILSMTEIYPLARARAMLTLGFGGYVGWSIGDPILAGLALAAGLGIFLATVASRFSIMLVAVALGVGGNGLLVYLALSGRFDAFFDGITLNLIGG